MIENTPMHVGYKDLLLKTLQPSAISLHLFNLLTSSVHETSDSQTMIVLVVLGSACVTLAAMLAWNLTTKSKKGQARTPPGPFNIPVIGQGFRFCISQANARFTEWTKEYGDIFMFKIFGRNVVVLNHPDLIRRAFVSKEYSQYFSDRPASFVGRYVGDGYKDILFRRYDDTCHKMKSATLKIMHEVGEGSEKYQASAMDEIKQYVADISASPDQNVDIIKPLELSLCKMIGILLTGELFPETAESLKAIRDFDIHGNEIVGPDVHTVLKLLPFLRFLPGYYGNLFRKVIREREALRNLLVKQMKEKFQVRQEPCLLHGLFKLQQTEDWLSDDYILGVIMDLINTSTLTSRGALSGFLFLLVHFPNVQSKIRQEIYDVIGKDRNPAPEDIQNMPYTHACILEVLRYQSHLSITATHTNAVDDVTFEGYVIPKGTAIFGNQWYVHHDERFWNQPWEFQPERFLQEDGAVIPPQHDLRNRYFMPFGVGKRECMGIKMSYNRMFLYITAILQTHQLLPPSDAQLPSHDPKNLLPGTVLQAPHFRCRVVPV